MKMNRNGAATNSNHHSPGMRMKVRKLVSLDTGPVDNEKKIMKLQPTYIQKESSTNKNELLAGVSWNRMTTSHFSIKLNMIRGGWIEEFETVKGYWKIDIKNPCLRHESIPIIFFSPSINTELGKFRCVCVENIHIHAMY